MSVKVMDRVWGLDCHPTVKLVLMKLADCASDDGRNVYPAQETVAKACGVSDRQVRTILAEAVAAGFIVAEPGPGNKPKRYRFAESIVRGGSPLPPGNVVPPGSPLPGRRKPTSTSGGSPLPTIRQGTVPEPEKKLPSVVKKKNGFVPPTEEECRAYATELRMPPGQGSAFFDWFETVGWKVGKAPGNPMKDWQCAMRTWKRRFVKDGGILVEPKPELRSAEPGSVGRPVTPLPEDPEEREKVRREARARLGIEDAEGGGARPQASDRSGLFVYRGGLIVELGDDSEAMTDERVFRSLGEVKDAVKKQGSDERRDSEGGGRDGRVRRDPGAADRADPHDDRALLRPFDGVRVAKGLPG